MSTSSRTFRDATRVRQVAGSVAALLFAVAALPFSTGAVAAEGPSQLAGTFSILSYVMTVEKSRRQFMIPKTPC